MRCPKCLGETLFRPSPNHYDIWICNHCYWRFMLFEPQEMIPRTMMKLLEKRQARKLIEQ